MGFLRSAADAYNIHIADEIGDSLIFASDNPRNMLHFATEIYLGFPVRTKVRGHGIKIRVGVWKGDVTGCVGPNFCGMVQYFGNAYNSVKKIEESTQKSLALSKPFYDKVSRLGLIDPMTALLKKKNIILTVTKGRLDEDKGRNEADIRTITSNVSSISFPTILRPLRPLRCRPVKKAKQVRGKSREEKKSSKDKTTMLNPVSGYSGVEKFQEVHRPTDLWARIQTALRLQEGKFYTEEEKKCPNSRAIPSREIYNGVPFGNGGIMFAQVVKDNGEPVSSWGQTYGRMCADMIRLVRRTDGVCLLEETGDCFLVCCPERNLKALFRLSEKMHNEISNHPGFALKIVMHFGEFSTGVNRYGMPALWGTPINEDVRQFYHLQARQTSITEAFAGQKAVRNEIIKWILKRTYRVHRPETIYAKGASGSHKWHDFTPQ